MSAAQLKRVQQQARTVLSSKYAEYACAEDCDCPERRNGKPAGMLNQYQAIGHSLTHNKDKWATSSYVSSSKELGKVMMKMTSDMEPVATATDGFFHELEYCSLPAEFDRATSCMVCQGV